MKAIVFDTEVNSLEAKEVVELAYCAVDFCDDHVEFGEIESRRYRPDQPFEAGSVAVHGITAYDVQSYRPSAEAKIPECEYLIAHNVDFDAEVMQDTTKLRICTLALSRYLWPEYLSHKLGAVFLELFGITPANVHRLKNAHEADTDVMITTQVLEKIVEKSAVKSFEELYTLSETARVPTVMTFGKHKGEKVADVPLSYIQWMLKQSDVDPYLRKAFTTRLHG